MALYILVRHHRDEQTYDNGWLDEASPDPALLEYIFTKPSLARECDAERQAGNRVFIHRCAHAGSPRVICASAVIDTVDLATNKVVFKDHALLQQQPQKRAARGQIRYWI